MKATKFCDFFEFDIQKGSFRDNEDGEIYRYQVEDTHEVFHTRYVDDVSDLTECFDSMLIDYIDSTLDDYEFVLNEESEKTFYEQAQEYIEKECSELYDTDTYHVICCINGNESIEDDIVEEIER